MIRALVLGVASLALAGQAPPPVEPPFCTPVQGTFTNTFFQGPPTCQTPPLYLCTQGQLAGDLPGSYGFTFTSNAPVGEGLAPVTAFTGNSLVTLATGTLHGEDFGLLRTPAFPIADFTTHLRIVSGTGAYHGATGQLTIQGQASFATGQGSGTYRGVLCVPR